MDKIVYFIAFCTIFLLGSCNSKQNVSLDFKTVFSVYKWTGRDKSVLNEERYAKIMDFLDNYDSEETYCGIYSVPPSSRDMESGLYRYVAKCSGVKFEHLAFKPLSDKHCGIAYYGQIEDSTDTEAPVYDGMMIYFQDTLSAKSFVDEAVKFGFKLVNNNEWISYTKKNPTEDPHEDSLFIANISQQYGASYYDSESVATYSVGISGHRNKNVVTLNWCP